MTILKQFPNYADAMPIEEIPLGMLDEEGFRERYLLRNRPFIVRGAAAHWEACRTWDLPMLKKRLSTVKDILGNSSGLFKKPLSEYGGDYVGEIREEAMRTKPKMSALEFFDALEAGDKIVAYGVSLDAQDGMEVVWSDFGSLSFFKPKPKSGFLYMSRAFFYRGGYTDWHFHFGDETVTVQVRGRKEFLLLPSDASSFEAMWPPSRKGGFVDLDFGQYPNLLKVRPYRAVLEPGDAIYIPVFWWHAVEPLDAEPGVTVAFVLRSAWNIQWDLRFRAARWNLEQALQRREVWHLIPVMLLGALGSVARHPLDPPYRDAMMNRLGPDRAHHPD